jgi:hypothetical protein
MGRIGANVIANKKCVRSGFMTSMSIMTRQFATRAVMTCSS